MDERNDLLTSAAQGKAKPDLGENPQYMCYIGVGRSFYKLVMITKEQANRPDVSPETPTGDLFLR